MDINYEMEHEELNVKEKNRPSEADLQQAGECGARSKNASHRPRRQLWAMFGTSRRAPSVLRTTRKGITLSRRRLAEMRRSRICYFNRRSVCAWALHDRS